MKKIISSKYFYICIVLIAIDQVVKLFMENYLNKKVILIDNFFYLNVVHNKGAAWSIMNNRVFLIVMISIVSLFILYYIQKNLDIKKTDLIFTFIYAGALGNMIDRIFYGYVIDYLDIYIYKYDFPVFNLADTFLVLGFAALIVKILITEREGKKDADKN